MAESHAAGLLDELNDRFVVLSDNEARLLLWSPRISKILGGVEAFTVGIQLASFWDDGVRFRFPAGAVESSSVTSSQNASA